MVEGLVGLGLIAAAVKLAGGGRDLAGRIMPHQGVPVPGCVVIVENMYGARKVFPFSRNGLAKSRVYGRKLGKDGRLGLGMILCEHGSTPIFQCSARWDSDRRKYGNSYCTLDTQVGPAGSRNDRPMTGQMRGPSIKRLQKEINRERKESQARMKAMRAR